MSATLHPDTRIKWMAVGAAFQRGDQECEQCIYRRSYTEHHPYGEGYAAERLTECTLGEMRSHTPDMCPAIQETEEV
jgi:hypothetical protein